MWKGNTKAEGKIRSEKVREEATARKKKKEEKEVEEVRSCRGRVAEILRGKSYAENGREQEERRIGDVKEGEETCSGWRVVDMLEGRAGEADTHGEGKEGGGRVLKGWRE